jgi:hypothetical protein
MRLGGHDEIDQPDAVEIAPLAEEHRVGIVGARSGGTSAETTQLGPIWTLSPMVTLPTITQPTPKLTLLPITGPLPGTHSLEMPKVTPWRTTQSSPKRA